MIKISSLSYQYSSGSEYTLNNINLEIKPNEFLAIMGKNGSGKSTLARLINGLLVPLQGEVTVDGINSRDVKQRLELRKRVGLLFANPDIQLVANTVEEDLAFGPGNLGLSREIIKTRIDNALEITGMKAYKKRTIETLSGGEKQLVGLAGLLTLNPRYLVLDEPTAFLDQANSAKVMTILSRVRRDGLAIVMISHRTREIVTADKVLVLDKGHAVFYGKPADLLADEKLLMNCGIEPEPVSDLARELNRSGVEVGKGVITVREMVNKLCQLR